MKAYFLVFLSIIAFSCSEKPRFELMNSDHTGVKFVNAVLETDSLHVMIFEYIYNSKL